MQIISLLVLGILFTILVPFNLILDAEAIRSHGVKNQKFGSTISGIVCGDKLCSEISEIISSPVNESIAHRASTPPKNILEPPHIDPQKGFFVKEINKGLYWFTDGIYQTMFLSTGKGVIAIDAPPTIGQKYLQAISAVTSEPVTHVIYSHSHRDHIGAANIFPDDVVIIAHKDTEKNLRLANDTNRLLPTITFDDKYVLQIGNQTLELAYYGPAHVEGNIFIYAPMQRVLMVVDVVKPGWAPFKTALDGDVRSFIKAHDKILEYDFDILNSGHVNRLGTAEDVLVSKQYIEDVKMNAAKALNEVKFGAIAKNVGLGKPWHLVDSYYDELAKNCANSLIPRWDAKLNEVEVFAEDHCSSMIKHLLLD